MTVARYRKIRTVLERRQPDLTVVMENVHTPHNLAAVARTADAVGIPEVHAVTTHGTVRLTQLAAAGCGRWITVTPHPDILKACAALRQRDMQILAANVDAGAVDYREVDYTRPTALILGTERQGISDEALRLADMHITIPMTGMVDSLNVSVAGALILFEAMRQREAEGLYSISRYAPRTLERLIFEGCHPMLARRCRERGLAYPPLDEEGDPVNVCPELRRPIKRVSP